MYNHLCKSVISHLALPSAKFGCDNILCRINKINFLLSLKPPMFHLVFYNLFKEEDLKRHTVLSTKKSLRYLEKKC